MMKRMWKPLGFAAAIGLTVLTPAVALADQPDSPQTRLRPIDAPSDVDRYRTAAGSNQLVSIGAPAPTDRPLAAPTDGPVRRTAWMQQSPSGPMLPPGSTFPPGSTLTPGSTPPASGGNGFALPPSGTVTAVPPAFPPALPPAAPPTVVAPPAGVSTTTPPVGTALPRPSSPPALATPLPSSPSLGDRTPLPAPQLSSGFATIGNCSCVSGPSRYTAASAPCGPQPTAYTGPGYAAPVTNAAPAYVPPPAQIAAPVALPPAGAVAAPAPVALATSAGGPCKPLISLGQQKNPVQLGRGIIGQPVAYVPGQWFRNWLRYVSP